ncbi:TPA: hypothetical protein RG892_001666 [Pseudomonas aeruginosa]|nr:hypothetical protein [Pseudomonas aeruginosa]
MNFIGCEGAWVVQEGVFSCTGTVRSFTADEMAKLLGSDFASLPLEQIVHYGIYYGLSYAAIIFIFKQLKRAIESI